MFQKDHLPKLGYSRQEALDREKTEFRECARQPHKLHMPTEGGWAEGLCWLFHCHVEVNAESQVHGPVAPSTSGVARSGWLQLQLPPSLLQRSFPYPEPDGTGKATEALLWAPSKILQIWQRLPCPSDGWMEALEGSYSMSWSEPSSQAQRSLRVGHLCWRQPRRHTHTHSHTRRAQIGTISEATVYLRFLTPAAH